MQYPHQCTVWRKDIGQNELGEDVTTTSPVIGLEAQECLYSTKTIIGKQDETAESLQVELSFILLPADADVRKDDEIRNIRWASNQDTMKQGIYTVGTISDKPSLVTGPHHKTATLHEAQ